jgi:hypothetical protein
MATLTLERASAIEAVTQVPVADKVTSEFAGGPGPEAGPQVPKRAGIVLTRAERGRIEVADFGLSGVAHLIHEDYSVIFIEP